MLQEMERALALLAFEDPSTSPVAALLDVGYRQDTAELVNAALLEAERAAGGMGGGGASAPDGRGGDGGEEPALVTLLQMLIWAQGQLAEKVTFPMVEDMAQGLFEEETKVGGKEKGKGD